MVIYSPIVVLSCKIFDFFVIIIVSSGENIMLIIYNINRWCGQKEHVCIERSSEFPFNWNIITSSIPNTKLLYTWTKQNWCASTISSPKAIAFNSIRSRRHRCHLKALKYTLWMALNPLHCTFIFNVFDFNRNSFHETISLFHGQIIKFVFFVWYSVYHRFLVI